MNKGSTVTVTDLFCGAGGSSLGMHAAGVDVALALNHWELAVESHNANFPDTDHDCADVSATDPRRYRSTSILWASPECTNHSISKGRKRKNLAQLELFGRLVEDPAEARSRATMFDVPRFAEYHDYDVVIVENVVDVRHWRLWDAWLHAMELLGYDYREVYFNSMFAHLDPAAVESMDDIVPQSRDRIYIVFWKRGHPAPDLEFRPLGRCDVCEADVETVQSWKNGRRWGRYKTQYVYRCPRCAAEVVPYHFAAWNAIDWSLPAERIGDRQKPLKERTMARIRKGLEKYGDTWLVFDMAYSDDERTRPMLAAPLMTQTGRQTAGMIAPTGDKWGLLTPFLMSYYGNGGDRDAAEPMATLTGTDRHALVMPMPLLAINYSPGYTKAAVEPTATITADDHHAVVVPQPFYIGYVNGDGPPHSMAEPLLTLHTQNGAGLAFPSSPPSVEECGFRMLQPHEVKRGMGFTDSYILLGSKRDQVRMSGNAVTPPVAKMLMRRVLATFE